jgi:putative ABC transport system permease protein
LLIACSNFINLTTAKSLERAKEIGLRKVVGGSRKQLITQFLFESFTYAISGAILAFAIVSISLPAFSAFSGRNLTLDIFYNSTAGLLFVVIILGVGFISGIYPALLMSSFSFSHAFKGVAKHGWKDILFRKGLVVLQFAIAIFLIAGSGLVFEQLKFLQNKNIGLNKDHVMEIPIMQADLGKAQTLLTEMKAHPKIVNAALTDFSFRYGISSVATLPEGSASNEVSSQRSISIDENFLSTFQVPLVAGRNFSQSYATDLEQGFIVNEKAVESFGWKTPQQALGKGIDWGLGKQGKVIGVVKDFNFASLHDEIRPLILHMVPEYYQMVSLRFRPDNLPATLSELKDKWTKIAPNSPFDYTFLDEDFANLYKAEMQMQSVLQLFTILSIVIACMGLLGLATFTVRQRYKEIGVRKVLGASVVSITHLLSKDFLKLVFIAIFLAIPAAWIAVDKWLQNFAYKTTISWWVLGLAAVSTLLLAFLTVCFQTVKAAHSNPVDNLRTE